MIFTTGILAVLGVLSASQAVIPLVPRAEFLQWIFYPGMVAVGYLTLCTMIVTAIALTGPIYRRRINFLERKLEVWNPLEQFFGLLAVLAILGFLALAVYLYHP